MVKNRVAMKNVPFQSQDVRKLVEEKFSSITEDEWLPVCKHVQEVEEKYIQNEYLVGNIAEELDDEDNNLEEILALSPDSE
jgi:hypothetical protein